MLLILKIISFLLGHLPLALTAALGKAVGSLAYRFDKSHRKRIIENLTTAFGNTLSPAERAAIARKVFQNLSTTALEFARIPWLKRKDLDGYVKCEGIENLTAALSKKKGVLLFTAHFGNWELMAAYYGLSGFPIDVVARELDSPVAEEFVKWVRTRSGNTVVSKNRAMRRLLKSLSQNGIAGILLDQNVALAEGVFVDYFGVPACTNKGPALLAEASGAAMVPTFIMREGRGHRLVIGKEVELRYSGDREADALENTARCTRVIEEVVRKHPEQWFWVHRRWKTRPQSQPS